MQELSIFVDESGSQRGHSRYCLVTLLLHNQANSIEAQTQSYEDDLRAKGLPDLPFHASPLMNGHDNYKSMGMDERKRLLSAFEGFVRRVPFSYKVFAYKRSEVDDPDYLCTLELTDLKYHEKQLTETDVKVFGEDYQAFKQNHLKKIRRKAL